MSSHNDILELAGNNFFLESQTLPAKTAFSSKYTIFFEDIIFSCQRSYASFPRLLMHYASQAFAFIRLLLLFIQIHLNYTERKQVLSSQLVGGLM